MLPSDAVRALAERDCAILRCDQSMQDESSSGHVGEVGCGGFIVRGEAFRARVKHRSVGDSEELMTLLFRCLFSPIFLAS